MGRTDPSVTRPAESMRALRIPNRFTSREAPQPPTKKKIAAGGRNASPDSRAESWSVACRYTVRRRNAPADAVIRIERTFAVRTLLRRTKESGIRGDADRRSIPRKPACATAESPRGTAVDRVRNPSFAAFVKAYTSRMRPVVTATAPATARRTSDARRWSAAMGRLARYAAKAPIGT